LAQAIDSKQFAQKRAKTPNRCRQATPTGKGKILVPFGCVTGKCSLDPFKIVLELSEHSSSSVELSLATETRQVIQDCQQK
jgi:hypothetical protein